MRACAALGICVVLVGCVEPGPHKDAGGVHTRVDPPAGVVVIAGGGAEGEIGDATSWSARLYGALLGCGDIDGDGRMRVAILSTERETDWLPRYFEWLGADEAANFRIDSRSAAATTSLEGFDAAFLKGGDQGLYHDLWIKPRNQSGYSRCSFL